jgi:hypothetical protein
VPKGRRPSACRRRCHSWRPEETELLACRKDRARHCTDRGGVVGRNCRGELLTFHPKVGAFGHSGIPCKLRELAELQGVVVPGSCVVARRYIERSCCNGRRSACGAGRTPTEQRDDHQHSQSDSPLHGEKVSFFEVRAWRARSQEPGVTENCPRPRGESCSGDWTTLSAIRSNGATDSCGHDLRSASCGARSARSVGRRVCSFSDGARSVRERRPLPG